MKRPAGVSQRQRVLSVMSDGEWHTLGNIRESIAQRWPKSDSEAAISARLRDLRKTEYGGHNVERRRISRSLYEYRIVFKPTQGELWN